MPKIPYELLCWLSASVDDLAGAIDNDQAVATVRAIASRCQAALESESIDTVDDVDALATGILNDPAARRAVLPPELATLYARRDTDERRELSRPTPADLERWNRAARDVPGPMGRCIRILLGEVARLSAEGERQRALLRRVRSYAVVDPLAASVTLPNALRMFGIETDIDDCLNGRPPRPGLDLFGKLTPEAVRRANAGVESDETDDS